MDSGAPAMRPLDLAGLLDAGFALYRRHFALLAGIAALIGIPEAILNSLISTATTSHRFTQPAKTGAIQFSGLQIGSIGGSGLVGFVFGALITGAIAYAVARIYLNEPTTITGAYRGVGRRGFLRLLGALIAGALIAIALFVVPLVLLIVGIAINLGILVALGVILIVAAAIMSLYLFVQWVFVPQAVVVDALSIRDAYRRSWNLVSGSWWRVFVIYLVLSIMVGVLTSIVGGISGTILVVSGGNTVAVFFSQLIAQIVGVLVQPFQLATLTLLFFDLRIRKEGFDLEQMVRTLDSPESK
jgi:hypothetical protein